ncbi:MAG: Rieske 2Fe-2S domain-containing protein [Candidatus Tectomicrobia bacterium]|uniref:Rieske 2Fe-2S domain-containing protein n=1 Tax=Tectimicrobiota bacterium TaxID=2528274 RepID=A0A937W565_UNCTE|nr:Rieske 2Fe-2S domain-containing protein [Candidatus Tectomicrobia bacterium]
MLSREDNELITRVGAGTPMGDTMRRYWIPALLAWELPEPDCPPVRVRLLGEDLVAFRDTAGRIGLLDEYCPHRLVSLFFGRNEGCGLRCVYHGWKFDVTGQCVDMMNEPDELNFKQKIHTTSYPTVEIGGIIWTYMGPPALQPALPKFAWTQTPETHRHVSKVIQESNWLQGLEGGIDTSHAPILHRVLTENTTRPGFKPSNPFVRGKAPNLVVDITEYGYQYAGVRPLGETEQHIRTYHFILPFHQIRPSTTAAGDLAIAGHIWVPMDDENTMVYNWDYSLGEPLTEEDRLDRRTGNGALDVDQTTFKSYKNRSNNYMIDREVQKYETFTGIDGINVQDRALQETMGRIVDRSKEHLGPADKAIIQARRLLLQAIKTVQEGGTPRGASKAYYLLRAAEGVLPRDLDWREVLTPEMAGVDIVQTV